MTRAKQDTETGAATGKPAAAPPPRAEKTKKTGRAGATSAAGKAARAREVGGRDGPEPTRYGDWEINGRCVDF